MGQAIRAYEGRLPSADEVKPGGTLQTKIRLKTKDAISAEFRKAVTTQGTKAGTPMVQAAAEALGLELFIHTPSRVYVVSGSASKWKQLQPVHLKLVDVHYTFLKPNGEVPKEAVQRWRQSAVTVLQADCALDGGGFTDSTERKRRRLTPSPAPRTDARARRLSPTPAASATPTTQRQKRARSVDTPPAQATPSRPNAPRPASLNTSERRAVAPLQATKPPLPPVPAYVTPLPHLVCPCGKWEPVLEWSNAMRIAKARAHWRACQGRLPPPPNRNASMEAVHAVQQFKYRKTAWARYMAKRQAFAKQHPASAGYLCSFDEADYSVMQYTRGKSTRYRCTQCHLYRGLGSFRSARCLHSDKQRRQPITDSTWRQRTAMADRVQKSVPRAAMTKEQRDKFRICDNEKYRARHSCAARGVQPKIGGLKHGEIYQSTYAKCRTKRGFNSLAWATRKKMRALGLAPQGANPY